VPKTGDDDLGDLAPVRIGAKDTKLSLSNLQVWRDLYYIADKQTYQPRHSNFITDFPQSDWSSLDSLPYTPSLWSLFDDRRSVEFPLTADQFFVMGDNSAESSDARLWGGAKDGQSPVHGQHLERRLLIGKALSVYWPHSWNRVPGTPIPFPLFPNIEDMRLVR
jgi:signal peptidase I